MGTRPSIGRFTLKAPVGHSMEASSGCFEIEAPVGRLMAASSGRYLTGAPVGRHHKASSGRSCQVAPIGHCHQASNGRFNLKAPTGRFHGASNGCFQGEAANGHAADPQSIILPRLSSPSSFHLVWTGLKPPIGRFWDASWTLRLDGKQIRPVRGQPRDGSQATKFWTTNGRPEVRPLIVCRDPWCNLTQVRLQGGLPGERSAWGPPDPPFKWLLSYTTGALCFASVGSQNVWQPQPL
ncbi:hypothetical protein PCANC_12447 [Puccinia coronata f. sp. avenae]|uniref:Uncharacterized protein n=1 Tax=Puccinia coronata f. sp. avenae TaxID=200324 RepID=A0A2N5T070_9BASI|nr:hypothetical protein PCANC_12447 [Puccinia coronata f. sp. avenae]